LKARICNCWSLLRDAMFAFGLPLLFVAAHLSDAIEPVEIRSADNRCWTISDGGALQTLHCKSASPDQLFKRLDNGCLQNPDQDLCLVPPGAINFMTTEKCSDRCQKLQFNNRGQIRLAGSDRCLSASTDPHLDGVLSVYCSRGEESQRWASGLGCSWVLSTFGNWRRITYSNGPSELTFKYGMSRDYEQTDSKEWGASVTASVEAGFEAGPVSASVSVSGTVSQNQGQTFSSTFGMSEESSVTYKFNRGGSIFQWVFDINDECGSNTANNNAFVITPGDFAPPCCLPGFAAEPDLQHGPCRPSEDGKAYVLPVQDCPVSGNATLVV